MGLSPDENHSITQSLQSTQVNATNANNGNGKSKDKGKEKEKEAPKQEQEPAKLEMTARYLGLVVIPGQYVAKIEAEEFASQMRGRKLTVIPPGPEGSGSGSGSA
jgi:hypothetical protein